MKLERGRLYPVEVDTFDHTGRSVPVGNVRWQANRKVLKVIGTATNSLRATLAPVAKGATYLRVTADVGEISVCRKLFMRVVDTPKIRTRKPRLSARRVRKR